MRVIVAMTEQTASLDWIFDPAGRFQQLQPLFVFFTLPRNTMSSPKPSVMKELLRPPKSALFCSKSVVCIAQLTALTASSGCLEQTTKFRANAGTDIHPP